MQEFRNSSFRDYQINMSQEERKENTFFAMDAFEEFFVRFAEEQLNATAPDISIIDHDVGE